MNFAFSSTQFPVHCSLSSKLSTIYVAWVTYIFFKYTTNEYLISGLIRRFFSGILSPESPYFLSQD